jgi:hypothetical protein
VVNFRENRNSLQDDQLLTGQRTLCFMYSLGQPVKMNMYHPRVSNSCTECNEDILSVSADFENLKIKIRKL